MEKENTSEVEAFRDMLALQGKLFLIRGDLPANKVELQFEGVLNGVSVVWHACVRTIEEYSLHNPVSDDPEQYINIEVVNERYKLEVGLNVSQIDLSVLESTIIMIRKYKRLRLGYHEYGVRSKTE